MAVWDFWNVLNLTPRQALLLSLLAAFATIALKAGAWLLTGSVGYLSDALESIVNVVGAAVALALVTYANQPPDTDHPFGHTKAEYFSAAFEGLLIFAAAIVILIVAVERLFNPRPLQALEWGSALSAVASAINFLVARVLLKVGRAHRSIALEADARHLMTDVWTTAGVIVGVALANWTSWYWLDPAVAIAVAVNILREGWGLLRRSADGLMDRRLSLDEIEQIRIIFARFESRGARFEQLRTRSAGSLRFAYVNLLVPGDWSVRRAHDLADDIEDAVQAVGITLTIHIEPRRATEKPIHHPKTPHRGDNSSSTVKHDA